MNDTLETPAKTEVSASDVRAWARARGLTVGNRGHLPGDVVARFNSAHRTKVFNNTNPMVAGRS